MSFTGKTFTLDIAGMKTSFIVKRETPDHLVVMDASGKDINLPIKYVKEWVRDGHMKPTDKLRMAASREAPIGSWIIMLGTKWVKKHTDQDVWVKTGQSGLQSAITYEDRMYNILETAWSEAQKDKADLEKAIKKAAEDSRGMELEIMKAPASQKKALLERTYKDADTMRLVLDKLNRFSN